MPRPGQTHRFLHLRTQARAAAFTATYALLATSALFIGTSCKAPLSTDSATGAATSPQAKAEPAPLAAPPPFEHSERGATLAARAFADAGPLPEPLRLEPLATDVLRGTVPESSREPRDGGWPSGAPTSISGPGPANGPAPRAELRELAGYSLVAVVRTGEGPAAAKAPEVNGAAIESAKRKAEAKLFISLSSSRARFVLGSGFVLPQGVELRARSDRHGHLLFWPDESTYRVAQSGVLRALFGERRLDVAPLSPGEIRAAGEGPRRLNFRTRRQEVSTRAGKAILELATLREAGEGGALACRLLLDLMSAAPSTTACPTDDVPLHAELRWTTRGALVFDVISVSRRIDFVTTDLAAPPGSAAYTDAPLPFEPADLLVARADLAAFRTAPGEVTAMGPKGSAAVAPESGLLLVNSTDELRVAWVDGVPAAWVGPGERLQLTALVRGRYAFQWRTFLGDAWEPAENATVPGMNEVGGAVR